MTAIVGSTGFLGTYLRTRLPHSDCYNSKNIEDIKGRCYDLVYCAGLPATKWMINKEPEKDMKNMLRLQECLKECRAKRFVLISTIDVYDKESLYQNEDGCQITSEPYGKHRHMMERWVLSNFENVHIVRLPGIFGHGLKKNVIFDLLNNNTEFINPHNVFQWYWLEDLFDDINDLINKNIAIANLFGEPLRVMDMIHEVFPCFSKMFARFKEPVTTVRYDYRTKASPTGYHRDTPYILKKLGEYVRFFMNTRYLAVSNLCWKPEDEKHALLVLKRLGIRKVELAPTRYGGWDSLDTETIKKTFHDFEIYSLQSLFYLTGLNVFEDPDGFVRHLGRVVKIAKELGASKLVFGSPMNRKLPQGFADPDKHLVDVFKRVDWMGVDMCIEPNSEQYGCNYITTISHAESLARRAGVLVNLDTGNAIMSGEECAVSDSSLLGHVQVSAPFLLEINGLDVKVPDGIVRSLEMKDVPIERLETNVIHFGLL